jgi:hypothetical protein
MPSNVATTGTRLPMPYVSFRSYGNITHAASPPSPPCSIVAVKEIGPGFFVGFGGMARQS